MLRTSCHLRELRDILAATGTPDNNWLFALTGHSRIRDGFADSNVAESEFNSNSPRSYRHVAPS